MRISFRHDDRAEDALRKAKSRIAGRPFSHEVRTEYLNGRTEVTLVLFVGDDCMGEVPLGYSFLERDERTWQ